MECPCLTGKYMLSCGANDKEVYVPSSFELGEYCKSVRYRICPLYSKVDGEWYLGIGCQNDFPLCKSDAREQNVFWPPGSREKSSIRG